MAIYKERDGKIEIMFPINDLDSMTGEEIHDHIKTVIGEVDAVIVNFSRVNYLNSSGLRELIQILKYLKDNGKKMVLTRLSENIQKIFTNTNLHRLFDIKDNDEQAKASF